MSNAAFDAYADSYGRALSEGLRYSGEDSEFFARGRVAWLARRLNELGVRPTMALDYGCGTGASTPHLLGISNVQEMLGVDPSEATLEVARARHGSDRATFANVRAPMPAGSVDLAHCNGVFHHIRPADRAGALHRIRRTLKPGGLFAFFENNPWNPGTRLVMRRIPFDHDAITISARFARRLLAESGFNVLRIDFLFVFPAALARLRPLEPALARFPFGAQYLVLVRKPR